MTKDQVVALMESSKTAREWNENLDKVKAACNGYPSFWWEAIVVSGVAERTANKWGGTEQLKIVSF